MTKENINPFVGLRPFQAEDSLYYFGRDEQTRDLLRQLHEDRFLGVVGASGSGKSSLVRAGLIPNLQAGFLVQDRDSWRFATMKPGDAPLAHLAETLLTAADGAESSSAESCDSFEETIRSKGVGGILERLQKALDGSSANLLLLVDQFEELFRFAGGGAQWEEAADFVSILLRLAEQEKAPIYVCLTMRSDFLGDCDRFHGLPEAMNRGQYLVPRLNRKQRRDAIAGPVGLTGAAVAPRLLDRLLNENIDTRDDLPILQHALMRTWEHWNERGGEGTIDLDDFEAVGGIENALNHHADEALAELDRSGQQLARRLFQALTEVDSGNRRIRRPARVSEITGIAVAAPAEIEIVIRKFREKGRSFLVVSTREGSEDALIDISHESLIRQWRRLRDWTDEEAESARVYRRLADTAQLHRAGKADVYHGIDLELAREWEKENHPRPAWGNRYHPGFDEALSFLSKSGQVHDTKQRREKRTLYLKIFLPVAAVIALLVTAFVVQMKLTEQEEYYRFASEAEAALAQTEMAELSSTDFQGAWLYPLEVLDRIDAAKLKDAEKRRGLKHFSRWDLAAGAYQTYWRSAPELSPKTKSPPEPYAISSIAFSPAGSREKSYFAAGSHDGTVTIRDLENPEKIAIGATDKKILARKCLAILDRPNGPPENEATPFRVSSITIASRKEGDLIAVAYYATDRPGSVRVVAQLIRLWDFSDPSKPKEIIPPITTSEGAGLTVELNSSGSILAAGSNDGSVRLWRISSSDQKFSPPELLEGHTGRVTSVDFSKDGHWLATASSDRTIRLWDLTQDQEAKILSGHSAPVSSVAFNPVRRSFMDAVGQLNDDCLFLASGSEDRSIRIWAIKESGEQATVNEAQVLQSHQDSVVSLAFSGDGSLLASGDLFDNDELGHISTIQLWDFYNGPQSAVCRELTTLQGHWDPVYSVSFSGDTRILGSASDDGTVRLWDLTHARALQNLKDLDPPPFEGHSAEVKSVAFDGEILISASSDGEVWNWNSSNPYQKPESPAFDFQEDSSSVIISRDGTKIAAIFAGKKKIRVSEKNGTSEGPPHLTVAILEGFSENARCVAFNSDATILVSGHEDGSVRFWDLSGLQPGKELLHEKAIVDLNQEGVQPPIRSVALSPDGKFLAAGTGQFEKGSDGKKASVLVWEVSGLGSENPSIFLKHVLRGHDHNVRRVVFAPNADSTEEPILASASSDSTIRLWDPVSGKGLAVLEGHTDSIRSAAFSPDGQLLATGSKDTTIRLWDVADPEWPFELTVLSGHASDVTSVAFSRPDGRKLASGSRHGMVRVWNLDKSLAFATDDGEVRQQIRTLLRDFGNRRQQSEAFQSLLQRSREHADLLDGESTDRQKYPMRKPGENPITWMLKNSND